MNVKERTAEAYQFIDMLDESTQKGMYIALQMFLASKVANTQKSLKACFGVSEK